MSAAAASELELQVALLGHEGERIGRLCHDLSDHFAAIACTEHPLGLRLDFLRTSTRLVCTLTPCCPQVEDQVAQHTTCAAEIAAIHGMMVSWSPRDAG